ncbi:CoA transferase [Bosea sp. BK604]|uniref:CoA transferase n=1 Tax=Bosea sp. BK604 TaxID=2512180 RepID=UPI0010E70CAA|nr:CoA transferase [Bosea sp. BK604]TCR68616.1 CoA transferase family III [Bosea sp. BK604]
MKSVFDSLADLWSSVGGEPDALNDVRLTGEEPGLPSSFRIGAAAQATIAALGLAASVRYRRRTGKSQTVSVAMQHAVAEFESERFVSIDGVAAKGFRDPLAGIYRCRDGGWFRPHITFPHHKRLLTTLLGLPEAPDRESLAAAIADWDAVSLEDAVIARGAAGAALRSFAEWDALPQARAAAQEPLVRIERIGDAPRDLSVQAGNGVLSGLRVLDLTRVIAGPVCGRAFAAYGAQVLAISSHTLPSIPQLVLDTNRGKFSADLDLDMAPAAARLRELAAEADIFLQSYRPGALERRGFGPEALARLRPGIVYVQLSAYGREGPWAGRRGFDSLVQTAAGFNHAEMLAAGDGIPRELPCQVLDHASGQLMALGAMIALDHRHREGGSWLVEVSLARTAAWLRGLGRLETGLTAAGKPPDPSFYCYQRSAEGGRLGGISPAAALSATPPRLIRATPRLGADPACWQSSVPRQ